MCVYSERCMVALRRKKWPSHSTLLIEKYRPKQHLNKRKETTMRKPDSGILT